MRQRLAITLAVIAAFGVTQGLGGSPARRRAVDPRPQSCSGGVIAGAAGVVDLAVDDLHVYFGDQGGNVWRTPKRGGTPTLLASVPGVMVFYLAIDDTHVYFETINQNTAIGTLHRVPKDGGEAVVLLAAIPGPWEFALDSEAVYVVSGGTWRPGWTWVSDGKVLRVRKDGSDVRTLASGLSVPRAIAVENGTVLFTESGIAEGNTSAGIRRVSVDGGGVTRIADIYHPFALATDAAAMYVIARGPSADHVLRVPRAGGAPQVLAGNLARALVQDLHVVDGWLYYLNETASSVWIEAVPCSGGDPRVALSAPFSFPQFASDGCLLYYATSNTIESVRRPSW